jgi:hypothetical protein
MRIIITRKPTRRLGDVRSFVAGCVDLMATIPSWQFTFDATGRRLVARLDHSPHEWHRGFVESLLPPESRNTCIITVSP